MIRPLVRIAPLSLLLVVTACGGASSYCLKPQKYDGAAALPPFRAVEGLKLPESQTALRIPPMPENPVPFGVEGADGEPICLDHPPALPVKAGPAAPAKTKAR